MRFHSILLLILGLVVGLLFSSSSLLTPQTLRVLNFQELEPHLLKKTINPNDPEVSKSDTRDKNLNYFFSVFLFSGTNINAAELIQYLKPVGGGPSLKTCPR